MTTSTTKDKDAANDLRDLRLDEIKQIIDEVLVSHQNKFRTNSFVRDVSCGGLDSWYCVCLVRVAWGATFSPHDLELINEKLSKLDLAVTYLWGSGSGEKVFYEIQLNQKSTFPKCRPVRLSINASHVKRTMLRDGIARWIYSMRVRMCCLFVMSVLKIRMV
jgi:hypothetical protein